MTRGRYLGVFAALLAAVAIVTPVAAQGDPSAAPSAVQTTTVTRLEAIFPAELAGMPLVVSSFSGDEVITGADPGDAVHELIDVAAAHGVEISDFAIASAAVREGTPFIGLLAATFEGVPAVDVLGDLTRLILETGDGVESTPEIVAGREAIRVGPGSGLTGEAVVYAIPSGEIAWFVVVADPEDLEAIVRTLPPFPPAEVVDRGTP